MIHHGPLGLTLAPELAARLEVRTKGWAAGLQLAGLSLRGQADPGSFIAQFAASHRTALDYLIDEVFAQQPAHLQRFLLQTAILDRLCPALCDAVMGVAQPSGEAYSRLLLDAVEGQNLFLIPLDSERSWYRYHHLFGLALRQRLQRQAPELVPALHRRAAAWLTAAGLAVEAIDHALAAGDYAHAADLVETATIPTWLYGEIDTLQRWLAALSPEACAARPDLLLWRAWSAVLLSNWSALEQTLAATEPVLAAQEPPGSPRWGELLALKGWRAALTGEVAAGYDLIMRGLVLLRPDDAFKRGYIGCQAAQAAWVLGDHDVASAQAAEAIAHHLKPHLGHLRLDKLAPEEVQAMFGALRTKPGGRAGGTPRLPSAKTVQNIRIVLRAALNQALKWGKVTRNVATLVDPPRVEKFKIAPLTREQAQQLLDAVRGERLEVLYRLALSLGLRKGEVLALHWGDLDFKQRTLKVAGSAQVIDGKQQIVPPKTAASVGTLPLPDVLAQALLRHREQQDLERAANGADWNKLDLVFPATNGNLIWPRNLNGTLKRVLRKAGLPETTRFHDLRHSCATLLIQQGVHLRVVMEILGHSSITITADTYAHVLPETQRDAVSQLDALFPADGGEQGRTEAD